MTLRCIEYLLKCVGVMQRPNAGINCQQMQVVIAEQRHRTDRQQEAAKDADPLSEAQPRERIGEGCG